ncbi:DUF4388 domain-containing protein [Acidobacteriota bacterium]
MVEGAEPRGSLRDTPLSDILRTIQIKGKTGVLVFSRGDDEKSLYFAEGKLVFASSNDTDERLGERLLRSGTISIGQYEESVKLLQETDKKQGAILCELGYITSEELFNGIQEQLGELIVELFSWKWGDYRFEGQSTSPVGAVEFPLNLNQIILEGVLGLKQWSIIITGLGGTTDIIFECTPDGDAILYDMEISEEIMQIFSLVNGKSTAIQMCSMSFLNEFETLRALRALQAVGAIQACS